MVRETLDKFFAKLVDFLKETETSYLLIGGLAVGILGEARTTQDIDIIISIKEKDITQFLKKAKKINFKFREEEILKNIKERGAFRFNYSSFWVDIIIASTSLEESAFQRKRRVKLLDKYIFLPSPEDLILFKLIPGRQKDILDAQTVAIRNLDRLDKKYLYRWAQKISDEAQDFRILRELKKLLK